MKVESIKINFKTHEIYNLSAMICNKYIDTIKMRNFKDIKEVIDYFNCHEMYNKICSLAETDLEECIKIKLELNGK
jgi:sulfur relay (sulfurtransferase) DsrF/TusC family protein